MMDIVKFNVKRGVNRGRPRVWMEGKHLTAAGFAIGDRYNVIPTASGLSIIAARDGSRKVSKKGDKPVMDLTGATLGCLIAVDRVEVSYSTTCRTLYLKEH